MKATSDSAEQPKAVRHAAPARRTGERAGIAEALHARLDGQAAGGVGAHAASARGVVSAQAIWPLRAAAVLLCLALASTYLLSGLYARYTTSATGTDEARVAVFGSSESVTLDSGDGLLASMIPGNSITYTITVSNAQGNRISEVAQSYNVEVETAGNLPLSFALSENGKGAITESSATSSAFSIHTFAADDMHFAAGDSQSKTYQLTVTWPADKIDAKYANVPDFIQVNVNASQID